MASCALLLSTPPSPLASTSSSPSPSRLANACLVASSRGGIVSWTGCREQSQLGVVGAGRRRGGGVVCEVAVELGGSRSSEGEEQKKAEAGTKIRVKGPLRVFHVPKNPELDVGGMEGEVKEVVTTFKGKPVSATFPFKVQLMTQGEERRKFFVHLKDHEFEVVE